MKTLLLFSRDLVGPPKALIGVGKAFLSLYWEMLFITLVFAYGIVVVLIYGMQHVQTLAQTHLHRGLWEDIMLVSQNPTPPFNAMTDCANQIKTQLAKSGLDFNLSLIRRTRATLNVDKVVISGHDVSTIHGHIDVWLKTYSPQFHVMAELTDLPHNSIAVSRQLAAKLGIKNHDDSSRATIYFSTHDISQLNGFSIFRVVDQGAKHNIVYLNAATLEKIGLRSDYNAIGINFISSTPDLVNVTMAKDFKAITAAQMNLQTASVSSISLHSSLSVLIHRAPFILLFLFTVILLINYHYKCVHHIQNRIFEYRMLTHFGLSRLKQHIGFSMHNSFIGSIALLLAWGIAAITIGGIMQYRGIEILNQLGITTSTFIFTPLTTIHLLSVMFFFECYGGWLFGHMCKRS